MSNAPQTGQFFNVDALARMPDASVIIVDEILRPDVDILFPAMAVLGVKGAPKAHAGLRGRTVYVWVIDPEPKVENIAAVAAMLQIVRGTQSPAAFLGNPGRVKQHVRANLEPVRKPEPIVEPVSAGEAVTTAANHAKTIKGNNVRRTGYSPSWDTMGLTLSDKGVPLAALDNCVRVLEHDPTFTGQIWHDTFLGKVLHKWNTDVDTEWGDHNDIALALHFQRVTGIPRVTSRMAGEAVVAYAMREKRNCAYDWLDSLQWDNQPRLRSLATLGFGTAGNEYEVAVCRNLILSMVKRVFEPGCKSDYMPIFEGSQGIGKSRALSIIGGAWFTESHESVTSKDFYGVLHGKWLIEIAEMHAFNQADVDKIKGIVSNPIDRYRPPYGRHTADYPRQCIFAGTTNRDDWNKDDTGARRFWPIKCGAIDHAWLTANREQLFAEAVSWIRDNDEAHWIVPWEQATLEQEERRHEDTWVAVFEHYVTHEPNYIETMSGKRLDQPEWSLRSNQLTETTIFNFLTEAMNMLPGRIERGHEMRAGRALKVAKWVRFKKRVGTKLNWAYRNSENKKDE